jgi:hypothetical protein
MSDFAALEVKLRQLGVPPSTYGLGHAKTEAFCVTHDGSEWAVFYSERDDRVNLATHTSFDDAAEDLVARLLASRSVQRMMREEHWRLGPDGRLFLSPPTAGPSDR